MAANESKLTRSSLSEMIPNNSDRAQRQAEQGDQPITQQRKSTIEQGERPKRQAVVKQPAIKQKKSLGKKIKEAFIGDDGRSVGDYVLYDVLVPAMKAMINDMVVGGIDRILFGDRGDRARNGNISRYGSRSYVSYSSAYGRDDRRSDRREISRSARARHNLDDVIYGTRNEADAVLQNLVDLTIEYGIASVADFYEFSAIEPEYTDDKYGWTTLRDAYVERVREGYIIVLPQPRPL